MRVLVARAGLDREDFTRLVAAPTERDLLVAADRVANMRYVPLGLRHVTLVEQLAAENPSLQVDVPTLDLSSPVFCPTEDDRDLPDSISLQRVELTLFRITFHPRQLRLVCEPLDIPRAEGTRRG